MTTLSIPSLAVRTTLPQPVRRVLVLDKNASSRRFLATALAAGGCDVTSAKDEAEALELLREDARFHLLVCDIFSVDPNELASLATLRAEARRAAILVLSSHWTTAELAHALEAGADDFLLKPYDLNAMRQAVSTLLSRTGHREHGAGKGTPLTGAKVAAHDTKDGAVLEMTAPTCSAQIESFQRFAERLASKKLSPSEHMNMHQALEELIQNAREWGNRFDPIKKIRLEFRLRSDRVVYSIEDQGAGFDPHAVPDPSINPKEHIQRRLDSGKRIGGWGIFIARKRMDELAYNAKGNKVVATKYFSSVLMNPSDTADDEGDSKDKRSTRRIPTLKQSHGKAKPHH